MSLSKPLHSVNHGVSFVFLLALALLSRPAAQHLEVTPVPEGPTVTGSVPSAGTPGNATHDYIFLSTPMDLQKAGYVEQEYFISGAARRYAIPEKPGEPKQLGTVPYRTRIVVRRPRDASRFSGVVVVDWQNVTAGCDIDIEWAQAGAFFIRAGWAWVGASVQRVGVHGFDPPNPLAGRALRQWSPHRYGALDVTASGSVTDDSQSYDIFSQVAQLVRRKGEGSIFNAMNVRRVYAGGSSQSANYLIRYYNSIQPITKAYDAFMVSIGGGAPRLDQPTKLFKVYTEGELWRFMATERVLDTESVHTWEIAAAPHVGTALMSPDPKNPQAVLGGVLARDVGPIVPYAQRQCSRPHPSRVETWVVHSAAYAALDRWVTKKSRPPAAERIQIAEPVPQDGPATIVRDKYGLSLGGIRLPRVVVPTALETGENSPANAAPENAFCRLYGSREPFDATTVKSLYPDRPAYLREIRRATHQLVDRGFVLKEDELTLLRNAELEAATVLGGR